MQRMQEQLEAEARPADQLLIYVSSHADEGQLHLGGTRLPVREVLQFAEHAPVRVALLVLDSCRSGVATRMKGLKSVPGVTLDVSAPDIRGRVVISSSAADELSQESDTLRGSYFTHHLVAALRGAGDSSRDGRVTLQEAYGYAYAKTVESTLVTKAGTQHPSFSLDLKGHGDLVLSEPRRAQSRLVINVEEPGEWWVASGDEVDLVGPFQKGRGIATLALTAGRYRLRARQGSEYLEVAVVVPAEGEVQVDRESVNRGKLVAARVKGTRATHASLFVGGWIGSGLFEPLAPSPGGEARLQVEQFRGLGPINLVYLSGSYRTVDTGEPLRISQVETTGRLGMGLGFFEVPVPETPQRFEANIALELSGTFVQQAAEATEPARVALVPGAGIRLGLVLTLAEPVSLDIGFRLGVTGLRTLQGIEAARTLALAAGLQLDL
jgi:hypothetical protein